jgi:ABC-type sugar transport system permease subunit
VVVSVLIVVNILYSTFVKYALVENKAFGDDLAKSLHSRTTSLGRYEGLMTELIVRCVYIFTGMKLCPYILKMFEVKSEMGLLLLNVVCITLLSVAMNMVVGFLLNALKQGNAEGDLAKYVPAVYNEPMMILWDFILSSLVTLVALFLHTKNICNSFEFIYLFFIAIFIGMFFFKTDKDGSHLHL